MFSRRVAEWWLMLNECVIARTIKNKASTNTTPTYKNTFSPLLYRGWMASLQSSTFGNNLSTLQRDHPCHSNCSKIYVPLKGTVHLFIWCLHDQNNYFNTIFCKMTAILCNYRITKIITSSKKGSQINHP